MGTRIMHTYHSSTVTTDVASIDTSFATAKVHQHTLTAIVPGTKFQSEVNGVYVRVKSITSPSATPTLTIRICCDADGDYTFLPDTQAELALGLTTNTTGVSVLQFDLPMAQFFNTDTVYLFVKIDQGTCTLDASCITWSE